MEDTPPRVRMGNVGLSHQQAQQQLFDQVAGMMWTACCVVVSMWAMSVQLLLNHYKCLSTVIRHLGGGGGGGGYNCGTVNA